MQKLKRELAKTILDSVSSICADHGLDEASVESAFEYPPDKKMGDLSFPCFKLSRVLRKSPADIAKIIARDVEKLDKIARTDVVGAYLNMYIADEYFSHDVLSEITERGDDYGKSDIGAGKTVVIDYSSPNVAKPFHIGHLGTTVIGHSLKMLYSARGYKCIGINHLGDWGTQFGKLIVAYRKWGDDKLIEEKGIDELVALYVRFHAEAEKDETLNDEARAEFSKLEHHDEENIRLWKRFIDISIKEYKKTYRQLGIEFDYYTGESFYTDLMPEQVQILRDKHLLKTDDGASIVDLSEYNMPPCLILKRDGSTLYPTRDIAAAVYRKRTFNFDKCIYVTSAGQSLHFAQWFTVLKLMGYDWYDELLHVPYGTVSINGEKLATRTGNVVLLKDLFATATDKVRDIIMEKNPDLEDKDSVAEAVGVGAIVFYYLLNSRIKDIDFNMEDALNFDGNTGPYAQYTYARCHSILDKAGDFSDDFGNYKPCESEIALLKTLSLFFEKIDAAISDSEPMVITRYILDVCSAFNGFYRDCRILTAEDESARNFRLNLTRAAMTVLGSAFGLICLKKTPRI